MKRSGRGARWADRPSARTRFSVETGFLVVVAAVAALAGLRPLWVIALMLLAWALVVLIEPASSRLEARGDEPKQTDASPPPVVDAQPAASELDPVEPLAEPSVEPHPQFEREPALPGPSAGEWNIWDLERVARARARAGEAGHDEEWMALFLNLRQFATADGVLPKEFDGLVRESFSELIQAA